MNINYKSVVKKKNWTDEYLWMLAGGDMQILTAKIAKKNNYKLLVTDKNKNAPCRFIADKFYNVDIVDIKKNYQIIKKLNLNISGIFTIASDCHLTVNKVAKRLNLHHTPIKISEICKNKIKTRKFLKKFFPQPKSFFIKKYSHYKKKVRELNCAYVIKHLNLSGSKGFRVFDKNFIISSSFFNRIKNETKNCQGIILEEKLQKNKDVKFSEMSVESVWQDGKIIYFNCVDRIFKRDLSVLTSLKSKLFENVKDGYEIGHVNPSAISKKKKLEIKKLLRKLGFHLGYDKLTNCHILKLDIFFSNQGPIILEMTPRFSGGYDSTGSSVKRGLKLSEAMFKICKGEKFNKADLSYYFRANKLKVLVLSRYLFGKRLFYLNVLQINNKKNLNKIFNKIKKNQTIKNEQIRY